MEHVEELLRRKLVTASIYLRVYALSGGEVFPELKEEFDTLWDACVEEAKTVQCLSQCGLRDTRQCTRKC